MIAGVAEIPADLAGTITFRLADQHADFFVRNNFVLLVEQNLHPQGPTYARWRNVPRTALDDRNFVAFVQRNLLEGLRPWTRPDRGAFPEIDLFPRTARLGRWIRRMDQKAQDFVVEHLERLRDRLEAI